MAWWKLEITDKVLNSEDREHIAEQIKQGFKEGELNAGIED